MTRPKPTSEPLPDGWHELRPGIKVRMRAGIPVELAGAKVLTVPEVATCTGASTQKVRRFVADVHDVAPTEAYQIRDRTMSWVVTLLAFEAWDYRYAATATRRAGKRRTEAEMALLRSEHSDEEVGRRLGRTAKAIYHARRRLHGG